MKVTIILHQIEGGEEKIAHPFVWTLCWHFDVFLSLRSWCNSTLIAPFVLIAHVVTTCL